LQQSQPGRQPHASVSELVDGTVAAVGAQQTLALNATLGWSWADPTAALVIAAIAVKEGRDAWQSNPKRWARRGPCPGPDPTSSTSWRSQLGWHRYMVRMFLVALCRARCVGTAPRC
jgi:hypothetical protein